MPAVAIRCILHVISAALSTASVAFGFIMAAPISSAGQTTIVELADALHTVDPRSHAPEPYEQLAVSRTISRGTARRPNPSICHHGGAE